MGLLAGPCGVARIVGLYFLLFSLCCMLVSGAEGLARVGASASGVCPVVSYW